MPKGDLHPSDDVRSQAHECGAPAPLSYGPRPGGGEPRAGPARWLIWHFFKEVGPFDTARFSVLRRHQVRQVAGGRAMIDFVKVNHKALLTFYYGRNPSRFIRRSMT